MYRRSLCSPAQRPPAQAKAQKSRESSRNQERAPASQDSLHNHGTPFYMSSAVECPCSALLLCADQQGSPCASLTSPQGQPGTQQLWNTHSDACYSLGYNVSYTVQYCNMQQPWLTFVKKVALWSIRLCPPKRPSSESSTTCQVGWNGARTGHDLELNKSRVVSTTRRAI